MSINRVAVWAYLIAIAVIVSDQALKYWLLDVFHLQARLDALPPDPGGHPPSIAVLGPLHLALVNNRGVSFGFLTLDAEWSRWALSLFSGFVAIVLAVWAARTDQPALAVALGLIMGGAVGNMIDRVRIGAVTDFIDVSRLWFPWVFNVADAAINIGSVILIWDLFLSPRKAAAPA
jgi:signal peptidase II